MFAALQKARERRFTVVCKQWFIHFNLHQQGIGFLLSPSSFEATFCLLSNERIHYLPFNISFMFFVLHAAFETKKRLTQFSTIHRGALDEEARERKVHFAITIWWSRRRKDFMKWAQYFPNQKKTKLGRRKRLKIIHFALVGSGACAVIRSCDMSIIRSQSSLKFNFNMKHWKIERKIMKTLSIWRHHRMTPQPQQHAWEKSVMRVSLFRLLFVRK